MKSQQIVQKKMWTRDGNHCSFPSYTQISSAVRTDILQQTIFIFRFERSGMHMSPQLLLSYKYSYMISTLKLTKR